MHADKFYFVSEKENRVILHAILFIFINSVLARMINHSLKSLKIESLEESELKKENLLENPT